MMKLIQKAIVTMVKKEKNNQNIFDNNINKKESHIENEKKMKKIRKLLKIMKKIIILIIKRIIP